MNIFKKVYRLLLPFQRKEAFILMPLMIFGMFLEAVSLGAVVPVTSIMVSGKFSQYPFLNFATEGLNVGEEQIIIYAMLGLAGLFLIKNIFLAFLAWRQANFSYSVRADLSNQLFSKYLNMPYAFHLQNNSAQLIRNVTAEASLIAVALNSIMTITTESLITLGVFFILMKVEPVGAISAIGFLGGAGWLFYRFTKMRILAWGQGRQYHDGMQLQHLQQGLGAIKDISILGRQGKLITEFSSHSEGIAHIEARQATFQQLPRLWLELLAVFGLVILVLTMQQSNHTGINIIPVVALFAVAAFRLLPSINRILAAIQLLRYGLPAIDLVYKDIYINKKKDLIKSPNLNDTPAIAPFSREIEVSKISYRYPEASKLALDDINFRIQKGSCVGFVGPSGSGKSTLVDVVLGLLEPQHGEIKVDGHNIQDNLRWWQNQIGYVPQSVVLVDSSLRANIAFGVPESEVDEESIKIAIKSAQIDEFIASLPDGLDTQVGERGVRLSGGQLQRIGIARALYHDPPILVLDEATSALDSVTENEVMQAVNALHRNKTILIIAHRLSTVMQCDVLCAIENGKIMAHGVPQEILYKEIV
jgi:ABC-type multidrug transport system fused ATPase/permease subunit